MLAALCRRAARRHSDLAGALRPLVGQQEKHVSSLRAAVTDLPHFRTSRRTVPGTRTDAAIAVRLALAAAQAQRRADSLAVESGALARLLASISASHAVAAADETLT